MEMTIDKFQSSDAWIFLSIAHSQSRKGASLEDVIGMADCINHAIPTDEEIENAINRLMAAGFIDRESNCFKLTQLSKPLFQTVCKKSKYLHKQWALLEQLLKKIEVPPLKTTRWKLKPGESKSAYSRYCKKL